MYYVILNGEKYAVKNNGYSYYFGYVNPANIVIMHEKIQMQIATHDISREQHIIWQTENKFTGPNLLAGMAILETTKEIQIITGGTQ